MDTSDPILLYQRLRQERIRRNWKQQELADQLGTTQVTVSRWENGSQRPSAYFREKLCVLFDKSAEELGLVPEFPQPYAASPALASNPDDLQEPIPLSVEIGDPDSRVSTLLAIERSHKQPDPDWYRMLRRLHRSYKELLKQSLHGITWVELGLSSQPDQVSNVTNLLFHLSHGDEGPLAPGISMLEVFDEAEGELLILGAPGAGKSTLLLDLAWRLVSRALMHGLPLLPVILPLSSWGRGRPALTDWMVEQLSRTYDVPLRLCEQWVQQGYLLPLFDGLDEVEDAARPACIAAINDYHGTRLTPLVVCSRHAEYEAAAQEQRLALQSAVIVQPLSAQQIEASLYAAGPSFAEIGTVLREHTVLWELARTPLMLSVILEAYQDTPISDLMSQERDLERQVWTDYVARQIHEKGDQTHYPLRQTHYWLSWLGRQMRTHQQTIFYAEHLDLDWLASPQQNMLTRVTIQVPSIVIGVCISFLVSIFLAGTTDLVFLLQLSVLGGFVGGCLISSRRERPAQLPKHLLARTTHYLRSAILFGGLVAASSGFYLHFGEQYYAVSDWLRDGSILGLGSLLSGWTFQMLLNRLPKPEVSVSSRRFDPRAHLPKWGRTMISLPLWRAGVPLILGIGVSEWVSQGIGIGRIHGLIEGVASGLAIALRFGLGISVTLVLVHLILNASLGTLRFAERITWRWRNLFQAGHLRRTVMAAAIASLLSGSFNALILVVLGSGLSSVLITGVFYGLSEGLSFGLTYWVVMGLYQGLRQEHLEDRNRSQFNQGIRYSLRNGLLISLICGTIIAVTGGLGLGLYIGLASAMRVGLSIGLRYGLSIGISAGLSMLVVAMVLMWALSGGPTILRHYMIRWELARRGIFPWRASAFLDDATNRILLYRVGGGYSFIHRRLQDYFADTMILPEEE